jgi:hypothetical protein
MSEVGEAEQSRTVSQLYRARCAIADTHATTVLVLV